MPADAAADSWIDMSAVRDKEMREEFVSPGPLISQGAKGVCFAFVERNFVFVSCTFWEQHMTCKFFYW